MMSIFLKYLSFMIKGKLLRIFWKKELKLAEVKQLMILSIPNAYNLLNNKYLLFTIQI